ncbi:helix-turn-helix transcriptional regulator [Arthrobacter sp.]|uniref:helix-turn-helix transcriptional regulator n=1 Tax=Arthrobacter sp. TaxID=1667 RepID=UPI003A947469
MDETIGRVLGLLNLLQSRPVWTGTELAAELGVTTRSIRRDVERLRRLGYPIRATQGVGGGYQLGAGKALPPLLLDDGEAVAVAVSLRLAAGGSVAGVGEAALRALAKLDQMLPARLRAPVEAVSSSTLSLDDARGGTGIVPSSRLLELARAIRTPEVVTFGYTAAGPDAVPAERRVEPYRLVSAGRRWYLMAFDLDRDAWRTFRLDRIEAMHSTGFRFARRDAPDAAEFVQTAISQNPYAHVARVRIQAAADTVRSQLPASVASVEPDGDDACILTAGGNSLEFVALHVALLGHEATVLEPAELLPVLRDVGARLARMGRQEPPRT